MFRYTKLTLLREVITILAAIALLVPFYLLIVTSLKTGEQVLTTSSLSWPQPPTTENFQFLLSPDSTGSEQVFQGLLASALITAGAIVGLIALGAPAAYVFARSTSRWSSRTFYLFLIAIILPTQLGVLPLYTGARRLGLLGSPWGWPSSTSACSCRCRCSCTRTSSGVFPTSTRSRRRSTARRRRASS